MVSLVSFDVKGAYNGVYKDRLLQRLQARGIPMDLVKWIDAFCSERTATIVVNGQASDVRTLEQAGLPQGSPLSPILFLFFNADLVQHSNHFEGFPQADQTMDHRRNSETYRFPEKIRHQRNFCMGSSQFYLRARAKSETAREAIHRRGTSDQ